MRFFICVAISALVFMQSANAEERSEKFLACLEGIKQAAHKAGISPSITERALKDVKEPAERVLKLSEVQPETKFHIWDYMAFLVDEQRVEDGMAMMKEHDATLRAVEKRFGVDRHVVAAVWGVETDYGRTAGRNFLPHALTTMVCKKRSPYRFLAQAIDRSLETGRTRRPGTGKIVRFMGGRLWSNAIYSDHLRTFRRGL